MDDILHRIEYLLADYDDGRSLHVRFAEYAGIDEQHASKIITGEKPLTADLIAVMQRRHGVSADWLVGEVGSPWDASLTGNAWDEEQFFETIKTEPVLIGLLSTLLQLEKQLDQAAESGELLREMRHLAAVAEGKDGVTNQASGNDNRSISAVRSIIKQSLAHAAVKYKISQDQFAGSAVEVIPERAENARARLEGSS